MCSTTWFARPSIRIVLLLFEVDDCVLPVHGSRSSESEVADPGLVLVLGKLGGIEHDAIVGVIGFILAVVMGEKSLRSPGSQRRP